MVRNWHVRGVHLFALEIISKKKKASKHDMEQKESGGQT
jgi:hypothetical protein